VPHLRTPQYLILLTGAILQLASASSSAQLGATIKGAPDAAQAAVVHRSQGAAVAFSETTDANGITVRQYVNASGLVYALSWRGPAAPDVRALLGAYFARFQESAAAPEASNGLHGVRVADAGLVVENHTRLREFSGRAWLPDALPAGVAASDIE
jgi:hypothetical protein